jgi:hypothetical protein
VRTPRLLLLSLLLTAVAVSALALSGGDHVVRREASSRVASAPHRCAARAVGVLSRWDRSRAEVWATGDAPALAALYVEGSRTAQRDATMLAGYRSRGLAVRSMHRQVLAVHVRVCTPRHLRLLVTDRLVEAVAVGHGRRIGLPPSRPLTRRMDLRRSSQGWRVTEVYDR